MDRLFSQLTLLDAHEDLVRNIVSLRSSQDLFDDLTDDPAVWLLAQQIESEVKPPTYQSHVPVIDRPYEDSQWFNAIQWPFKHWQTSRFSDGSYGVWYGCDGVEATVHETAYHWYWGLLSDAGFENETVRIERKLYLVACDAALLNFKDALENHPDLLHKTDYLLTQRVGARIHHEGHPGLVLPSVRYPSGLTYAVFNAAVLSRPRPHSQLTYRLDHGRVFIEKQVGATWLEIDPQQL